MLQQSASWTRREGYWKRDRASYSIFPIGTNRIEFLFSLLPEEGKEIAVFNFLYTLILGYTQLSTCCRNDFMKVYLHFLTGLC